MCKVKDNYQTQMWLSSLIIPTLKTLHSFGFIPSFKNVPGVSKFQSAVKWSETWRRPGGWKINVMTPERAGKRPPAAAGSAVGGGEKGVKSGKISARLMSYSLAD